MLKILIPWEMNQLRENKIIHLELHINKALPRHLIFILIKGYYRDVSSTVKVAIRIFTIISK